MYILEILKEGTDEKCCGACKRMLDEDTDGRGYCETHKDITWCDMVCDEFEVREEDEA